jgi:hypothetical protein
MQHFIKLGAQCIAMCLQANILPNLNWPGSHLQSMCASWLSEVFEHFDLHFLRLKPKLCSGWFKMCLPQRLLLERYKQIRQMSCNYYEWLYRLFQLNNMHKL